MASNIQYKRNRIRILDFLASTSSAGIISTHPNPSPCCGVPCWTEITGVYHCHPWLSSTFYRFGLVPKSNRDVYNTLVVLAQCHSLAILYFILMFILHSSAYLALTTFSRVEDYRVYLQYCFVVQP